MDIIGQNFIGIKEQCTSRSINELHYGNGINWVKKSSMVLPQFFQFVNIWKKLQTNLFPINLPKYFLKALMRQNGIKSKE